MKKHSRHAKTQRKILTTPAKTARSLRNPGPRTPHENPALPAFAPPSRRQVSRSTWRARRGPTASRRRRLGPKGPIECLPFVAFLFLALRVQDHPIPPRPFSGSTFTFKAILRRYLDPNWVVVRPGAPNVGFWGRMGRCCLSDGGAVLSTWTQRRPHPATRLALTGPLVVPPSEVRHDWIPIGCYFNIFQ